MSEFVRTETIDAVTTVTIDRPDLHNAFNEVVMAEISDAFTVAGKDASVRAIVLRSEGKSFSAGADINWMKRMVDYSLDENVKDAFVLSNMLRTIRECPKPVIMRVQGATFGGGVGLVAAADMAVAVESAFFCLSEVKLGIVPAVISPFLLEKIGLTHARRYGLTAERFGAQEAKRIGLLSECVASVEAMDAWIDDVVAALKKNGPQAVAACKKVFFEVADAGWNESHNITTKCIAERRVSPEGQEGLKAFLEKRKPNWIA